MSSSAPVPGILYVVATPIGNLEDLSFRALRILKEVAVVAAEDTRHSRKLFQHYGITTPLTSCHAHNEAAKGELLLARLEQGESIALISDAGTPAISDPGYLLVRQCRERGIAVTAVPGPSALTAALSIAGLPVDRFAFEGFLPAKQGARRQTLQRLRQEERTLVFYEAPHRLMATLHDILAELGNRREVAVARELSKLHEELFRGTAEAALAHFGRERVRGEIVLLLAPGEREESRETVRQALQRWRQDSELPMREIVKRVAREFDLPGSEVYKESLALRQDEMGGGMMEGKGRILVVDDHKTVVRLMEAVLKIKGYGVLHAEDGLTGVEVARRERPDLIFLDIMMPGLDGFEVCRKLKTDPVTAAIPIIFLTARGEESDVAIGKAAGCDGFIKKPFRTLEVLSLVEQHLRRD